MPKIRDMLAPEDVDMVGRAVKAATEGDFFPEIEFSTIFGIDRASLRRVYVGWPEPEMELRDFRLAVLDTLNNLTGYPHNMDDELAYYVPEGIDALLRVQRELRARWPGGH